MEEVNTVKQAAELARIGAATIELVGLPTGMVDDIPVGRLVDKDGRTSFVSVKTLIDEWREHPEFTKGTAVLATLDSFIALVDRHKNDDTAIFGAIDVSAPSLTAVVDYTTRAHDPRHGRHRLTYPFPLSPEWKAWQAFNAKSMTQIEWAAFIEEHIAELSSPTDGERSEYERLFQTKIALPTELITLSRGMQINVEARVKDMRVLQTGESEIVYEEVHKDGAGQKLVVPGLFVIQVPLFVDGDPVRLLARLRYRRHDGKLTWFYQLYRPDIVLRAKLKDDFDRVAKETGLPVFEGKPEA